MDKYKVTGMSCAACSTRVEKAVSSVKGVSSCNVNLLTNSMLVEGTAKPSDIVNAVEQAGYHASFEDLKRDKNEFESDEFKDTEISILKKRLAISIIFLIILMYFSMGYYMWGFPLPKWFEGNDVSIGIIQLCLAVIVMIINQKFFINGFRGIIHKAPNMDTLVALGSASAFIYSLYSLLLMARAQADGNLGYVQQLRMEFYFESAAMILTLITLGKLLEAYSKGKTTNALKSLIKLAPKMAVILRNGIETKVPIEEVKKGDVFIVRPGETIPADGIIIKGQSAVNESSLTGESIPIDKKEGDTISAATINQSGYLECEAMRVGEDTTLAQIIKMVSDASATKAPIAKIADKVSGIFVPVVISIAVFTTIIWLIVGQSFGYALCRGIAVLVISCPCALGLATPVAIMVGNGIGAKNGILFKTAMAIEETGKAKIVVLDKTGTITNGEPVVTDFILVDGISEEELLSIAAALEQKSEHPIAKAILKEANKRKLDINEVSDFCSLPGNGLKAKLGETEIFGGNLKYIGQMINIPKEITEGADKFAAKGKTPLYFAKGEKIIGSIIVADTIKEDSISAINELKNMGMDVYMLTGDNERTAKAIGKEVGVNQVISEVLPEGKESVVQELCSNGKVIMVGDGINDAIALTRADIGIAIGNGTDVAIDAADVVLMNSRLSDVVSAIRLSKYTLKNIKENLFWAFIYNIIGIPLATGMLIPIFGWQLSPMFGAAAMSLSSFCVVTNALRLNMVNIHKDKKSVKFKEEKNMEKVMKIEGMMCGHCEARVKKVLEELTQVDVADVNHNTNTALVKLNSEISDDELKKTVEEQGYNVIDIQ